MRKGTICLLLFGALIPTGWCQVPRDTKLFLNMMANIFHNCYRKVVSLNQLKLKVQYHSAFETGFVSCRIQEKYRMMVEKLVAFKKRENAFESLVAVSILEEFEILYWDITHLTGMMHEIERKYNVNIPRGEKYQDTTTTTTTTTTTKKIKFKSKNPNKTKVVKGLKRSTAFYLKDFVQLTTPKFKQERWKFRDWDYGWELEYDWWNIHPLLGRVSQEPPGFYQKHPLDPYFDHPTTAKKRN